ncbi:MAG: M1 family aminopeptidase [Planctomycetota bacterium]|nr:M1 family aminopeptidase [Planctomycetota bacterium]
MKRTLSVLVAASFLLSPSRDAHSQGARGGAALKPPFDGPARYPRTIPADFLHLRAELSFDWEKEEVSGKVHHRFRSLRDSFRKLVLDAVDIEFLAVQDGDGRSLEHRAFDDRVEIELREPLRRGQESSVTLTYRCRPRRGIYFISPIPEYPDRPRQVWTQGESELARHWLPCFDSPAERLTTELLVTVPESMDVLSNGVRLANEKRGDGQRTVHWKQEKEHVVYLICFAAGEYDKLTDSWDGIPITSWHYPGDAERAKVSFHLTADMMGLFSDRFGRYPWPKYDQIVVRDFVAGGMENTTATILTDGTLHRAEHEPHVSSRGLVAHELAHQWFGDLVTCRDWAHLWLNESFATFAAALYTEHHLGRPDAQMERRRQAISYLSEDRNRYRRPIVARTYRSPGNMFDRHSYPKGARVIEMLRRFLGDERFFSALRFYLDRHRYQSVETAEFRRALEDATGESLGWFFDQWVHHGGHPEVRVREEYDPDERRLSLRVAQTQDVNRLTPLFRLPVDVGIYFSGGEVQKESVWIERQEETLSFRVPSRPAFVRFDRESILLLELDHEKSREEWLAQLRGDPDTLGRIAAAEELGESLERSRDEDAQRGLVDRLFTEAFWGVRQAIARALGKGGGEASVKALARCLREEKDGRVRETAAESLGELGQRGGLDALEAAYRGDASDWVRSASLRAHHRVDRQGSRRLAREALDVPSHRERLRTAAVGILDDLDDRESLEKILELCRPGAPRRVRYRALAALPRLGRESDEVRKALIAQIDDPHRRTRRAVHAALGRLGGDEARRALMARKPREEREEMRKALDEAIERAGRATTTEELARELEALKRKQQEVERRLKELEERKGE